MTEKSEGSGAPAPRTPTPGRCICDHLKAEHTLRSEYMQRAFPGQVWEGCRLCGCFVFRQEDEISIGLADGTLRMVVDCSEGEPRAAPSEAAVETREGEEK